MSETSLPDGLATLARRTVVVRIGLISYLCLTALAIVCWTGVLAQGIEPDADLSHPLVLIASMASLGDVLVYFACIVAVGMWIHRAHANLHAAMMDGLKFTPGWAVGWFFVPFALLFKPFEAMRELWERSHLEPDDNAAPADRRLYAWWGCWLIGNFMGHKLLRMGEAADRITAFDIAGYAFHLVAAWFLLDIVNSVARAQASDLDARYAFA